MTDEEKEKTKHQKRADFVELLTKATVIRSETITSSLFQKKRGRVWRSRNHLRRLCSRSDRGGWVASKDRGWVAAEAEMVVGEKKIQKEREKT
ncbi:hypothetical protein GBA52_020757 [Prunus armeniaca]|nr:hypothetical protein GBA52_020757 [Prunus armeniaca]